MGRKLVVGVSLICMIWLCAACAKETEQGKNVTDAAVTEQQKEITDANVAERTETESATAAVTEQPESARVKKNKEKKRKKPMPKADEIVSVREYIPDIKIDLRYASKNNFTGKKIYDFKDAYLRYGTIQKLKKAQRSLRKEKLSLLIWDAYRPARAQFKLWETCPDARYVANPHRGFSSHSRGNTIDVTLCSAESGEPLEMPTGFDDFSKKADRDYSDCMQKERKNAFKLEKLMKNMGFTAYRNEWWHFTDRQSYPVKKNRSGLK